MAKSARRGGGGAAGGRRSKDTEFQVEEAAVDSGPKAGLESGLVVVTFVALLIGIVMAQMELGDAFGKGLFGG